MQEQKFDGVLIRSPHKLADYMPALAVALMRSQGRASVPVVTYMADFVKGALQAERTDIFPKGATRSAAEMRVMRLLAYPIQVGDVVISLVSKPQRKMREKSKQIVTTVGTLESLGVDTSMQSPERPVSPVPVAGYGGYATPRPAAPHYPDAATPPASHTVPPAPAAPQAPVWTSETFRKQLKALSLEMHTYTDRLNALEETLAFVAGKYLQDGDDSRADAVMPIPEGSNLARALRPLRHRCIRAEQNLDRVLEALDKGDISQFKPYTFSARVPVDNEPVYEGEGNRDGFVDTDGELHWDFQR